MTGGSAFKTKKEIHFYQNLQAKIADLPFDTPRVLAPRSSDMHKCLCLV